MVRYLIWDIIRDFPTNNFAFSRRSPRTWHFCLHFGRRSSGFFCLSSRFCYLLVVFANFWVLTCMFIFWGFGMIGSIKLLILIVWRWVFMEKCSQFLPKMWFWEGDDKSATWTIIQLRRWNVYSILPLFCITDYYILRGNSW